MKSYGTHSKDRKKHLEKEVEELTKKVTVLEESLQTQQAEMKFHRANSKHEIQQLHEVGKIARWPMVAWHCCSFTSGYMLAANAQIAKHDAALDQIAKLKKERDAMMEQNRKLSMDHKTIKLEFSNMQEECVRWSQMNGKITAECANVQDALNKAREEIAALKKRLRQLEKDEEKLHELKRAAIQLREEEVLKLKKRAKLANKEAEHEAIEASVLRSQLQHTEASMYSIQGEVERLQRELSVERASSPASGRTGVSPRTPETVVEPGTSRTEGVVSPRSTMTPVRRNISRVSQGAVDLLKELGGSPSLPSDVNTLQRELLSAREELKKEHSRQERERRHLKFEEARAAMPTSSLKRPLYPSEPPLSESPLASARKSPRETESTIEGLGLLTPGARSIRSIRTTTKREAETGDEKEPKRKSVR
eukprot:Platyproteum_vivax@DN4485_c0_g1_i2.p1